MAATAALAGCRTAPADPPEPANSLDPTDTNVLPTYRPAEVITPDLPGTADAMAGYYAYPTNPKPAFDEPPATALGTVSLMYPSFRPAPPTPPQNTFWAQLQSDLGAEAQLQGIPSGDYTAKFQAQVASSDLPDLVALPPSLPDRERVMTSVFADLTPLLAGDAAEEFPFLANIPTYSWGSSVADGTLRAVPQHRSPTGGSLFMRTDRFDDTGANPEPGNLDEFVETLAALSDPDDDRWALSTVPQLHNQLSAMMGGLNQWGHSDDGTLISAYQHPAYREALELTADLVSRGYTHPGGTTATTADHRGFFTSGATALHFDGYAAWEVLAADLPQRSMLAFLVTPQADGGGDSGQIRSSGRHSVVSVNKNLTGDKLHAALGVLNFLAAPIGTLEHQHRKYGQPTSDSVKTDIGWELTEAGERNLLELQYIVDSPTILGPGPQEEVDIQHAWHTRVSKTLITNPALGITTDTVQSALPAANRELLDIVTGVYYGRNTMSDFDSALQRWEDKAGTQSAEELQTALAD